MFNPESFQPKVRQIRDIYDVQDRYSVPRTIGVLSEHATDIENDLLALPEGRRLWVKYEGGMIPVNIKMSLAEIALTYQSEIAQDA
jgi:hypothetical protein